MENYEHKKFSQGLNKRKLNAISNVEDSFQTEITVDTSVTSNSDHPAKCHQTQTFFRPWLSEADNVGGNADNSEKKRRSKRSTGRQTSKYPYIIQYHPNKVRTFPPKERSAKEQQRRDRNTLSCLLSRRARKIEQAQTEEEYTQFREQQQSIAEESLRLNMYLQELQRLTAGASWIPAQDHPALLPSTQAISSCRPVFVFGQQ